MPLDWEPSRELEAEPGEWEHAFMRQCIFPGCAKWFDYTRNIDVRCPKHAADRGAGRHKNRDNFARDFLGVDGEGGGTNEHGQQNYRLMRAAGTEGKAYTLFNDNEPLPTIDCLDFILSLPEKANICGYYFDYDVSMILRDLPKERIDRLLQGQDAGLTEQDQDNDIASTGRRVSPYTWWRDYAIEYIPRQYFRVARLKRDRLTGKVEVAENSARTINEVGGFFQKPFVRALADWNIADAETLQMLTRMKEERPNFDRIDPDITRYCETECRQLATMMTKLRETCIAGTAELREAFENLNKKAKQEGYLTNASVLPETISLVPSRWRGAGYIATKMFKSTNTPARKEVEEVATYPPDLEMMFKMAYFGGRFEIAGPGYFKGPISEYDINSAYPAAMSETPCPLHTRWHEVARPEPGSLYIADLAFEHPLNNRWCGFPIRTKQGLHWPLKGSGVYLSEEIEAAKELGAKIKIRRAFQAKKCCDCAPHNWVPHVYDFRLKIGKAAKGYPIKLGLNALYGKKAQRNGARPFHNLVDASLITAMTRAKLTRAIALDPTAILMTATDAIYSTRPLALPVDKALGNWEAKIHPDIFIVQPGIYWFPGAEGAAEIAHKTRGIPKTVVAENAERFSATWKEFITRQEPFSHPKLDDVPTVVVPLNQFIGIRQALHRGDLKLAGRWFHKCKGGDCDHTNCGRKRIDFDWSNKRAFGQVDLAGTHILTRPIPGSVDIRSLPYDPKLLTGLRDQALEMEGQPDFIQYVDHGGLPSGEE